MSKNDFKKLHEMIKLAKLAVEDVEEPLRSVTYGVYLSKLLDSEASPAQNKVVHDLKTSNNFTDVELKKETLARKCNITKSELETVLSIHNDSVEVISPVYGNDAQKHIIGTQVILAATESILSLDWTSSSMLIESLRGMGIMDLGNVSLNLKKYPHLIRSRGTRGHREYKLTSGVGRQSAYDLIERLAKGGKLNEN